MSRALAGKTILISGASAGIGAEVARQLAGRQNRLIITARSRDLLDAVADAVRARGSTCLALTHDAADAPATQAVVDQIIDEVGPIDVALLNIGSGPAYNLATATIAEIDECMRLNYAVTVNYLVPLIAHMRERGAGLIAHTNSLACFLPVPMQGPYSAAKSAARTLIDTARTELRGSGIRFLSIYPGFIATARTAEDGIPAPFELSEAEAARHMIKAMESNRDDYCFPWQTTALTGLLRALPKRTAGSIMLRLAADEY
jgi:short-subunit dehydrogenase